MVGLTLIIGVPLLAAITARVVATIPARAPEQQSGATHPSPQFPGWARRSWLIGAMAAPMLVLDYTDSPNAMIFWWSLAGPFAVARFGTSESMLQASVMASILVAMTAAHPVRPSWVTALVSVSGFGAWFMFGFGTMRLAV